MSGHRGSDGSRPGLAQGAVDPAPRAPAGDVAEVLVRRLVRAVEADAVEMVADRPAIVGVAPAPVGGIADAAERHHRGGAQRRDQTVPLHGPEMAARRADQAARPSQPGTPVAASRLCHERQRSSCRRQRVGEGPSLARGLQRLALQAEIPLRGQVALAEQHHGRLAVEAGLGVLEHLLVLGQELAHQRPGHGLQQVERRHVPVERVGEHRAVLGQGRREGVVRDALRARPRSAPGARRAGGTRSPRRARRRAAGRPASSWWWRGSSW